MQRQNLPLLLIGILLVLTFTQPVSAWYDNAWGYRVNVTINSSQVNNTTLNNFPLWINLTQFNATFWNNVNSSGLDIVVTNSTDFRLDREVSYINSTNHSGSVWTLVNLSNASNQVFYVYYGNPSANILNNKTVWGTSTDTTGYRAVYHFDEGAGNTTANDSTVFNNTGNLTGTAVFSNTGRGLGGQVRTNVGNSGIVNISNSHSLNISSAVTLEVWVNNTNVIGGNYQGIMHKGSQYSLYGPEISGKFQMYAPGGGGALSSTSVVSNVRNHVVFSATGSRKLVYINGVLENNTTDTNLPTNSTNFLAIGADGGLSQWCNCSIDEARVYSGVLETSYIVTEYFNQNKSSGFYTASNPEQNNVVGPTYYNQTVTPASPQSYGVNNIWINITWNTSNASLANISKGWIIHDFNGTNVTYFISNTSSSFFPYNWNIQPKAGTYTFTLYANDTLGTNNQTSSQNYVINKAGATLNMSINGTFGDYNATYPEVTNTTATVNVSNGNITLLRNGTLVNSSTTLTSISRILSLASATYNYTVQLSHENYTATQVTRILTVNKAASGLVLSITPGLTINEGTQSNASCTANAATTLTRDSLSVSNPNVATLGFGSYNYTCSIQDSENYTPSSTTSILNVLAGGFGCTNTTTYAFLQNFTNAPVTLNFTTFVNNFYIKNDLSDVFVDNTSFNITKNTTGGYYLIVNNTTSNTNFTVKFGNFIANNSWNVSNRAATVSNVSNYSEINPYYFLTYYLEQNGTNVLPPAANSTQTLYCGNGSSSFALPNGTTKLLVSAFTQLASMRTTVQYSAASVYYRDYVVRAPVEFKPIYLVDATSVQVLQNVFKLIDNTGSFGSGTVFKVKELLGSSLALITELAFDAESKSIAYLINGGKYQIYVDNGVEERALGDIYPDPSSLTKNIIINSQTYFNTSVGFAYHLLNFTNGVFTFAWNDPSNGTILTKFQVYNWSNNNTLVFEANSTNRSYVSFTYVADNKSNFRTVWLVYNNVTGKNNTIGGTDYWNGAHDSPTNILQTMISYLGGGTIWFVLVFVVTIPMLFTRRHLGTGAFVFVGAGALFLYWGWWQMSATLIGVGILFAILIEAKTKKKYGDD